jgi:DNA-binding MarR family transcriptional regulator
MVTRARASAGSSATDSPPDASDVDALMRASKVVSAAIAHSLAVTDAKVTLPQLRVLVMVEDGAPLNLSAVAEGLGVNPSNASRTCDRLVKGGLLDRREDPADRRHVVLTLTAGGRRVLRSMLGQRRTIFQQVLDEMRPADRARLTAGLNAFSDAAQALSNQGLGLSDGDGHLLRRLQ